MQGTRASNGVTFLQIAQVLIAASLGAVSVAARGAIVYQDTAAALITTRTADCQVDFDLDGSPDVFFRYYEDCDFGPFHQYTDVYVGTAVDRAMIATHADRFALGMSAGEIIGPSLTFKATASLQWGEDFACDSSFAYQKGDWLGSCVRYMGIKVLAADGVHYGWARVENQVGSHTGFRVLDAAMESRPGVPIVAGDRGGCVSFMSEPTGVSTVVGQTLTLSSVVTGNATSYQWYRDGAPIRDDARLSGCTRRCLNIRDAKLDDTAAYSVVVTGPCGAIASQEASVRVDGDCRAMPGGEIVLDGVDDFAVVGDSPDFAFTTRATVELWVRPSKLNGSVKLLNKGDVSWCGAHSWSIEYGGQALYAIPTCTMQVSFTPSPGCRYATLTIPCGGAERWTHLAMTIDTSAGVLRGYVNGVEAASTTTCTDGSPIAGRTIALSAGPVGIGCATLGLLPLSTPLRGEIDEVRLWNIARSASQIGAAFAGEVSASSPGLAACYRFESDALSGVDSSGGGHALTRRGGATVGSSAVCCGADFDGSGYADTEDFDAFVRAFEAGTLRADVDRSGFLDLEDFQEFVRSFESGC